MDSSTSQKGLAVVTAYYRLPGKHSHDDYLRWITNFFQVFRKDVYCYAEDEASIEALRELVPQESEITFLEFPFVEFDSNHMGVDWEKHSSLDPERSIHSPALYSIWAQKSRFVHRVADLAPGYSTLAWIDIGLVREEVQLHELLRTWNQDTVVENCSDNRIHLLEIEPFTFRESAVSRLGRIPNFDHVNRIGGTVQVGTRIAWSNWVNAYERMALRLQTADRFSGKDQTVMAQIALTQPRLCQLWNVSQSRNFDQIDPWMRLPLVLSCQRSLGRMRALSRTRARAAQRMKRTFALVKKMARKMKSYSHKAIDWFRQTSGLSGAKQLATYAIPFRRAPKILIVAPGLLPIPPSGWGAVELLTHETAIELSNKFHVTVLNSRSLWSWISVLRNRYVAAVVHYEEMVAPTSLVRALRFRDRPILFCSHYGYLDQPMKWNPEFRRKFGKALKHLRKTDYFLALSPSIAKVVREMTQAQTIYSPNGSSLTPVHRARGGGGLLILGKVEDRKRQFEVVSALRAEFPLTCVGPIADARVENLLRSQVDKSLREIFVGPWSRAEVAERLSSYDVLLLPSEAEADALVLYEAQLAGLSIIVCSRAIGSQDPTLPWVHSVDDLEDLGLLKTTVSTAIRNNPKLRSQIVKHAEDTYRWRERLKAVDFLLEVGL